MRKIEVVNSYKDKNINLPRRSTKYSAGYDIEAAETIIIPPLKRVYETDVLDLEESQQINKQYQNKATLVPTGLKFCCEEDEYIQFVPRSSIASKNNLILANSPSTIDGDYYNNPSNEGHCYIPIINLNSYPIKIKKGDRIAQAIFCKFLTVEDDEPINKERNGGFGSTGVK